MERRSQKDLEIFPRLYNDLLKHDRNTLNKFAVEYHHVKVKEITDESDYFEPYVCCEEAVKRIRNAEGKNMGLVSSIQNGKQLNCVSCCKVKLKIKANHLAVVLSKLHSERYHNDIVLAKSDQATVENTTRKINKILHKK